MSLSVAALKPFVSKHRVFVETGTNKGDGVQCALDAGFQTIVSIEFYPKTFELCCNRFKGNPKVTLLQNDSAIGLKTAIANLSEPALFWLDAHFMSGMETDKPSCTPCPVLAELAAIGEHPIKTQDRKSVV